MVNRRTTSQPHDRYSLKIDVSGNVG